jgi:hypothetical protein
MLLAFTLGVGALGTTLVAHGMKTGLPMGTLVGILAYTVCMLSYHRSMFSTRCYYCAPPKQVRELRVPVVSDVVPTRSISTVENHFWFWFWSAPLLLSALVAFWNWDRFTTWILFA